MKRFAPFVVLGCAVVALLPATVAAQEDNPGAPAVGMPTLQEAVLPAVAERLGVTAERVAIELGRLPTDRTVDTSRPVRLKGSGSGGIFIVDAIDLEGERLGIQIKAGVRTHEAVAARPLERGHHIEADDIRLVEVVRYGNEQPPSGSVQGWEVARTIGAGEALREPAIRRPPIVRSGAAVRVLWANDKVVLALAGTALSTGAVGETITVRLETGRRVRGVAQSDGTIRLEGGTP